MMLLALAAAASPTSYRALGTEPFWSLTIAARTMRFERPDAVAMTVRRPSVRRSFNQRRFVTRGMAVTVTHARCSDGMSDRVYADRVTVKVGRTTYHGCGGASLGAVGSVGSLEKVTWRIAEVNGAAPQVARPATLRFEGGQISGNAGCNAFGGAYQLAGERLTVGRLISTKMACPGVGMETERAVMEVLGKAIAIRWPREQVTLSNDAGTLVLAPR